MVEVKANGLRRDYSWTLQTDKTKSEILEDLVDSLYDSRREVFDDIYEYYMDYEGGYYSRMEARAVF